LRFGLLPLEKKTPTMQQFFRIVGIKQEKEGGNLQKLNANPAQLFRNKLQKSGVEPNEIFEYGLLSRTIRRPETILNMPRWPALCDIHHVPTAEQAGV
jgi:hypothetical protein